MRISKLVKSLLPDSAVEHIRRRRREKRLAIINNLSSNEEVFSAIYEHRMWGGAGTDFYSGHGSHDRDFVEPYLTAVSTFLASLDPKPVVVDLGCGDFSVGSNLVLYASKYIACDVVPNLVERNRKVYADLPVEFRHLDMVASDLPRGDVAILREVLQHLNNAGVKAVAEKLPAFRYVIVTEQLPKGDFTPNIDKPTGYDVRMNHRSGVDLCAAPFSLKPAEAKVLFEFDMGSTIARTTLYRM